MKVAILGGSFNPIHVGHLALADEVCVALGYDRLLFVPSCTSPHKRAAAAVPAQERLQMVRLACAGDARFEAEGCEVERGGTSYTFDTVCHILRKYDGQLDGPPALVLGEDLLAGFHLWYRAEEISRLCRLVLARRSRQAQEEGFANTPTGAYGSLPGSFDWRTEPLFKDAVCVENPELAVSSTEIRARAAQGKSFRYLVPAPVFEYIKERGIYADGHS